MQGLRRTKSVLGLDLGAAGVKLVELTRGVVRSCAYAPRPHGEGCAKAAAAAALKQALQQAAPRTTRAVVSLDAADVIVHRFAAPPDLPQTELEAQARAQARQAAPYPLDEACYDYLLEHTGEHNSSYRMAIARWSSVQALCRQIEEVGLTVAAVDMTPFAIQRTLRGLHADAGVWALLDGGYRQTRLTLFCDGKVAFQHSQPFGCGELAARLSSAYGLSPDDTHRAMQEWAQGSGFGASVREPFLRDLGRHAGRALQLYLASRRKALPPERVLLWGGSALVRGACRILQETLKMPVSRADPLGDLTDGAKAPDFSPLFLGAYALALNNHG